MSTEQSKAFVDDLNDAIKRAEADAEKARAVYHAAMDVNDAAQAALARVRGLLAHYSYVTREGASK